MSETGMHSARRRLLALGAMGLLGGCGVLPSQRTGPAIYRISRKSTFDANLPKVSWALAIAEPLAQPSLDSDRLAFIKESLQIDYYADSIWEARAPVMLQAALVQSFIASGRIDNVGTDRDLRDPTMLLRLDLRAFNTREAAGRPLAVRVAIFAQLLRMPQRRVAISRTFEQEVEITGSGMDGVVTAFDASAGIVQRQLVEWTLRSGATVSAGLGAPAATG